MERENRLRDAFTQLPYLGDADVKLTEYLRRCWRAYQDDRSVAPCTSIVQSSGFGKSRLVFQLAQQSLKHDEWRVLYVCVRYGESSGFPKATRCVRDWLFGDRWNMSQRLQEAYHYAQQHWPTVGEHWIKLFTDGGADSREKMNLKETSERLWSKKSESAAFKGLGGVLILAVDEARSLYGSTDMGYNHYLHLLRALNDANEQIRVSQSNGGVFAVLVDTHPKVSGLVRPTSSSENDEWQYQLQMFPPFILAHTTDVYWKNEHLGANEDEIAAYKRVVIGDADVATDALVSMGRPMWASTHYAWRLEGWHRDTATERVVNFASMKLMLGCSPRIESNFDEWSLSGAASLLCRLGLRLRSTTTLAPVVVANFMAVLAYVNHEKDGLVCSYASDPVLALGATRVWYAVSANLPKFILPAFKKMLLRGEIVTGGIDLVVTRVLLLLATDACVVMATKATNHSQCTFEGQFISVDMFLQALGGHEPAVLTTKHKLADKHVEDAFKKWRSQWDAWRMGFSHFVQLVLEPNEETLWFLLARRAAGVFPRDGESGGADLVIPMFCGSKASMMLVRVEDVESEYLESVTESMYPSVVFGEGNPLSLMSPRDIIRVFVSLREPVPSGHRDRCVLTDAADAADDTGPLSPAKKKTKTKIMSKPTGASTDDDMFTLWIRSVGPWELEDGWMSRDSQKREDEPVIREIVSEAVATELADLVSSRWDIMGEIDSDLRNRHTMEEMSARRFRVHLSSLMSDSEMLESASKSLAELPRSAIGGDGDSVLMSEEKAPDPTNLSM
jgi:hypothetical protein